jgi:type III restriction enzyme
VIFRIATNIFRIEKPNWRGNEFDFLSQLLKLTEEFLKSDKIVIKTNLFNQDKVRKNILLTLNISRIIQHFWVAIKDQNAEVIAPVFDSEKPIRSTSDMPTCTPQSRIHGIKNHTSITRFSTVHGKQIMQILLTVMKQ